MKTLDTLQNVVIHTRKADTPPPNPKFPVKRWNGYGLRFYWRPQSGKAPEKVVFNVPVEQAGVNLPGTSYRAYQPAASGLKYANPNGAQTYVRAEELSTRQEAEDMIRLFEAEGVEMDRTVYTHALSGVFALTREPWEDRNTYSIRAAGSTDDSQWMNVGILRAQMYRMGIGCPVKLLPLTDHPGRYYWEPVPPQPNYDLPEWPIPCRDLNHSEMFAPVGNFSQEWGVVDLVVPVPAPLTLESLDARLKVLEAETNK